MFEFRKKRPWSLDSLTPPSGDLRSIYSQIEAGVLEPLPDEQIIFPPNQIRWVSGAMDGILGRAATGEDADQHAHAVVRGVQNLAKSAHSDTLASLYKNVVSRGIVSHVDKILEDLNSSSSPADRHRILEIGRYFARRAGHRDAVKFGLAVIGIFGSSDDAPLLRTLGRHEEFTLFAAVALARVSSQPEKSLWELARQVHGWGRIQIVRRLADTEDTEIQSWMLRDGFRNDVMNEYLACICARAGRLHEALNQQFVDTPLLNAAGELIRALINGGPAEDIDDYEHSADACESYLNIVWSRDDLDLPHFITVGRLRAFLGEEQGWEKRAAHGWSDFRRNSLQALVDDVIGRQRWRALIHEALSSPDEYRFYTGNEAAGILQLDTWKVHFDRVKVAPMDHSWYHLMKQTDKSRIVEVLAFAESVLPFKEIATGPDDKLGLGPEFKAHLTLGWIVQDLGRFPGLGWRFIATGLRSPVVSNRNMAIRALAAWPSEAWTPEIKEFVRLAEAEEPRADVKARLGNLLAGRPLESSNCASDKV